VSRIKFATGGFCDKLVSKERDKMKISCEHFGRCGGCTYLDIPYEEELSIKEATLKETLGEYGNLLERACSSPIVEGYRNKMELAFGDDGPERHLALGIRKRRSFYEVAGVENCILIPDDFKRIAQYVLQYFRDCGEAFYHRKRHVGALRHLVLRRGAFTGEVLVNLSTTSTMTAPIEPLVEGLLALPLDGQLVGILHSVNDGVADAVKNENVHLLWGRDFYNEEICGLKFRVAASAFFQTNSAGAEILYGIVRDFAGTSDAKLSLAYDLYCGTGTIAQIVSPLFERVVGIELVKDAIISARANAQLNGISNCEFRAGDVLGEIAPGAEIPDVIIVDPPRDGLHPKALPQIAALSAPRIIYVACKPKSLARDLPLLEQAGYHITRLAAVDMFPRTPHVEAIALLQKLRLP